MTPIFLNQDGESQKRGAYDWASLIIGGAGDYFGGQTERERIKLEQEKLDLQRQLLAMQQGNQAGQPDPFVQPSESGAQDKTEDKPSTPKWILPTAIVGGILLIGGISYFALRKS